MKAYQIITFLCVSVCEEDIQKLYEEFPELLVLESSLSINTHSKNTYCSGSGVISFIRLTATDVLTSVAESVDRMCLTLCAIIR
jgi:hypothetical protein